MRWKRMRGNARILLARSPQFLATKSLTFAGVTSWKGI
jgi:hypothetical protein